MNKIFLFLLAACLCVACQTGPGYKEVRDEVTAFHDSLMLQHEHLISNQMKLDTLQQQNAAGLPDTSVQAARTMVQRLQLTEKAMDDWMHAFEPDATGKSNEEAVTYFQNEKTKIKHLNDRYKRDLAASDSLLKQLKHE